MPSYDLHIVGEIAPVHMPLKPVCMFLSPVTKTSFAWCNSDDLNDLGDCFDLLQPKGIVCFLES